MRWIVLMAVLATQTDNLTGQWVGPLEMTVQTPQKMRGAIPTDIELRETDGKITGAWRSRPPNTSSGTFTGTRDKLDIVFYADSDESPERCQAVIHATARLTVANVYRIEADKMVPDTRPKKECGNWPTDLVWLLQRAH